MYFFDMACKIQVGLCPPSLSRHIPSCQSLATCCSLILPLRSLMRKRLRAAASPACAGLARSLGAGEYLARVGLYEGLAGRGAAGSR